MRRWHLECALACVILAGTGCRDLPPQAEPPLPGATAVNDVHSRLNETMVAGIAAPRTTSDVIALVERARREGLSISISGSRHAMGGQQFGTGTLHVSMTDMDDVLDFDRDRGIVRVEAGIEWPELIDYLLEEQTGEWPQWGVTQKQTGADRLTIGGALSANAHGRGLRLRPMVQDIESFTLIDGGGRLLTVSRKQNPEVFSLVIGGYGLFGIVATVDLRLSRRVKLERVVEILPVENLMGAFRERIDSGYLYGDYQFKTDETAPDFLTTGVFSSYRPLPDDATIHPARERLSAENWDRLLALAHTDKAAAFELYSQFYLSSNGQRYWSDTHQLSYYNPDYESKLGEMVPGHQPGSLMISELYVPRQEFEAFMRTVAIDLRRSGADVIYGTVRLIEQDDESYLAWASRDYACIIFNLRVEHSDAGITAARADFRRLIDRALEFGGSYYLTYHRWARRDQLLAAYPQFPDFLRRKLEHDPAQRFQSDWYRHYIEMMTP